MKPRLHLLDLSPYPILEQLKIEEALLRADERNWCLVNKGSSPTIVMGISGKPEQLINVDKWQKDPIPLVRRFSGGGTVVVDENTLFVTFICNADEVAIPSLPEPILRWTEQLYQELFSHPDFKLIDNDYVIGDRKCGGNAQYLRKKRWLHHTSFLWDYCSHRMSYLLHPPKTPAYRQQRGHEQFLIRLKELFCDLNFPNTLFNSLERHFTLINSDLSEINPLLNLPYRKTVISCDS